MTGTWWLSTSITSALGVTQLAPSTSATKTNGIEGDISETKVEATPDLEDGFVEDLESTLSCSVAHYLYLSGTPFRALTEGEFLEEQVYNWTYSDEQRAKKDWKDLAKPIPALPQMFLLAYEMPETLKEVALNNMSEFSLTEFFRIEKDAEPDIRSRGRSTEVARSAPWPRSLIPLGERVQHESPAASI